MEGCAAAGKWAGRRPSPHSKNAAPLLGKWLVCVGTMAAGVREAQGRGCLSPASVAFWEGFALFKLPLEADLYFLLFKKLLWNCSLARGFVCLSIKSTIYLITGTSLLGEGSGWLVEGQSPLCEGWSTPPIVKTRGNALPRPPQTMKAVAIKAIE